MCRRPLRAGLLRAAAALMVCAASLCGAGANIRTTLLTLPDPVDDYTWDATRGRIYASTAGNVISIINPEAAQVEGSIAVGDPARQLQTSGDGRYLYALLTTRHTVRRYDLTTQAMDLEFALDPNVAAFAPLPGQPQSIVVAYRDYDKPVTHFEVFDGAVMRPGVATVEVNYPSVDNLSLYVRPRDGTLFASGGDRIFWLEVNASGVTVRRSAPTPFYIYERPTWKGDIVLDSRGCVFDLEKGMAVGQINPPRTPDMRPFAPDALGTSIVAYRVDNAGLRSLTKYSTSTFLPVGYAEFDPAFSDPLTEYGTWSMKSWGLDGMAINRAQKFLFFHMPDMDAPPSSLPTASWEASGVMRFPFPAGGLVYDQARGVLWASIPGNVPTIGNSVVSIDPATGQIVDAIYAGSDPGPLALSIDGSRLFTALRGAPLVVPIDIAQKTREAPFSVLDEGAPNGTYWLANSLLAAPGGPDSVSVVRSGISYSGELRSVLIYDGARARRLTFAKAVDALIRTESPGSVYAVNLTTTMGDRQGNYASALYRLTLEPDGVVLSGEVQPIPLGIFYYRPKTLVYGAGALFTSAGGMWGDEVNRSLVGSFDAVGVPVPLPARGQVAFVRTGVFSGPAGVTVFDLPTFRPLTTVSIESRFQDVLLGAVGAGDRAIAFFTQQETVLVPFSSLTAWPSLSTEAQIVKTGVRVLPIPVKALTALPGSSRLLLATPSSAGELGNSILTLNPETGRVEKVTFAGSEPAILSPTADGTAVWVSLAGENRVARIRPSTGVRDLVFAADPAGGSQQNPAFDMAAGPDGSVAISYWGGAIAVFDEGKPRPVVDWNDTSPFASPSSAFSLSFNESRDLIYAFNGGVSLYDLKRCQVSQEGVTWLSAADSLISGYYTRVKYAEGLLYDSHGYVIDPERSRIVGKFATSSWDVLPDPQNRRVFFLSENSLSVFDMDTHSLIGSLALELPNWPGWFGNPPEYRSNLVRFGNDGIAVNGGSALYLIRISSIPMLAVPVPSPQIAPPSNSRVALVDVATEDLSYDSSRDRIYASVPNREAAMGDQIAVIDPGKASIVSTYPSGPNPKLLALSEDRSQLYFSMGKRTGSSRISEGVRTLDLDKGTIGPKFGEQPATSLSWAEITGLKAVPGQPGVVAEADGRWEYRRIGGIEGSWVLAGPASHTVRVYDGGAVRSNTLDVGCATMQADETGSRLYCAHWNALSRVALDTAGVQLLSAGKVDDVGELLYSGGRIYTTNGLVIEAGTMQVIGSVPVKGPVAVDGGRVFWLESLYNTAQPTVALRSFDARTLEAIETREIKVTKLDASRLIPCGHGRLAFRAGNEVYIVYPQEGTPQAPAFTREGVVNSATFVVGAPAGGLVSIFGMNLLIGIEGIVAATAVPLPLNLAGTEVTIGGRGVPILAVASLNGLDQINIQVPFDFEGRTLPLIVNSGGIRSTSVDIEVLRTHPGIFMVGAEQPAVVHSADGSLVTASNPASPGETLSVYCTGLGAVEPPVAEGFAAPLSPLSRTANSTTATVGGVPVEVSFAGLAPGFVGLYQVDVRVPEETSSGTRTLVLTAAAVSSQPVSFVVR
jgi:uncharacterized protein (TIGR03437 family)